MWRGVGLGRERVAPKRVRRGDGRSPRQPGRDLSREASRGHYADGTDFHPGKIETVANTVTYLDSLFHRYKNGKDLSELPLSYLAELPAVVVRCTRHSIGVEMFEGVDVTSEV